MKLNPMNLNSMNLHADEGFFFGLSVFETICLREGRPLLLENHLERLKSSAIFLGITSSTAAASPVTASQVYGWLEAEKKKGNSLLENGGLKIVLSQENLHFSLRENPYREETYQKGFRMDYSAVRRNETSPLVCHKTANYGDCILENRACHAAGMNERIFLNTRGELAEGTVSNLFFIRDGELFTPARSCGLLPGIIRQWLLDREPVREIFIRPCQVSQFEECFVTNSLMGIMPVRRLGDHTFDSMDQTLCLRRRYLEEVR